jgi:hypothetical protein
VIDVHYPPKSQFYLNDFFEKSTGSDLPDYFSRICVKKEPGYVLSATTKEFVKMHLWAIVPPLEPSQTRIWGRTLKPHAALLKPHAALLTPHALLMLP